MGRTVTIPCKCASCLTVWRSTLAPRYCIECGVSYERVSRPSDDSITSNPEDYRTIPLSAGKVAKVTPEDYEWLSQYTWSFTPSFKHGGGYAVRVEFLDGKWVKFHMHREVSASSAEVVDHKNGDSLDNRRSNLRPTSRKRNLQNTSANKSGSSQFRGVSRQGKYWRAQIFSDGVGTHLGTFKTEIEAAIAYNQAAKERFGEFARLNEIPELDRRVG